MDSSKLPLFMVFMVSALAARLIPNGDVDKEHNSDDQERLDRQDYTPRRRVPKPAILATGICVQSPSLPCCEKTIRVYEMLQGPDDIADPSYPNCRNDGYYASKQCNWSFCHCVDPNGESVEGTTQQPKNAYYYNRYNIICPDEIIGGREIMRPTAGHREAHGCVQWGEPCTVGETNCCGDSKYDGTCEWRVGSWFRYACGVKSGFPIKLD